MAVYGNGLDEDWRVVLEICSLEIVDLKAGSCQDNLHAQVHHNKHVLNAGSCQFSVRSTTNKCATTAHHRLHFWASAFRTSICIVAIVYLNTIQVPAFCWPNSTTTNILMPRILIRGIETWRRNILARMRPSAMSWQVIMLSID